jgi:hypothetical protein
LDEGKVSQSEYEIVKTEILEASPEDWSSASASTEPSTADTTNDGQTTGAHEKPSERHVDHTPEDPESSPAPDWVVFVKKIPVQYWAAMGATVVTFFFAGAFVPVAWVAAIVSGVALATTKVRNGRWMAWIGIVVGVVFSLSSVVSADQPPSIGPGPVTTAVTSRPEALPEVPVGALDLQFSEISERWNALDEPPFVLKGISTTPEAGALDSFTYRFDGGAVLAGAYNPSDGFVYALMVNAGMQHPLAGGAYVHLCYLLYPGTHECFDAYVEESGVFGKTAAELGDGDHNALWLFEGNEWRLDIADGVQTMRVLGPQEEG